MRLVLDTSVVIAGLRGPTGASAALLRRLATGEWTLLLSVALALEYEAVCLRPEQLLATMVAPADMEVFVNTLITLAEPVDIHFLWRPVLRDPDDDMVFEAAVNGGAHAIVTFNLRDFGDTPKRFGIETLLPSDALKRIRQ